MLFCMQSGTDSALPDGMTQFVPKDKGGKIGDTGKFTGAISNVHADFTDNCAAVEMKGLQSVAVQAKISPEVAGSVIKFLAGEGSE